MQGARFVVEEMCVRWVFSYLPVEANRASGIAGSFRILHVRLPSWSSQIAFLETNEPLRSGGPSNPVRLCLIGADSSEVP